MVDHTEAQLRNGAAAVAYRALQLADVARIIVRPAMRVPEAWMARAVSNALVESALVNARGLAWFFTKRSDVHTSWFLGKPDEGVSPVASLVSRSVSRHLSHATAGRREGEAHPGCWPVPELAAVLVGGLHRYVLTIDDENVASWFSPPPYDTWRSLDESGALAYRTDEESATTNQAVSELTATLHRYLDNDGQTHWDPVRSGGP